MEHQINSVDIFRDIFIIYRCLSLKEKRCWGEIKTISNFYGVKSWGKKDLRQLGAQYDCLTRGIVLSKTLNHCQICFIPANGEKLIKPFVSQIQSYECWKGKTLIHSQWYQEGKQQQFWNEPSKCQRSRETWSSCSIRNKTSSRTPWERQPLGGLGSQWPHWESLTILKVVPQ